jgi:CheY-like chemotaxis protein
VIPASARTSVTVPPVPGRSTLPPWVVLIVDDEPSVHDVTKLALRRLRFEGRKLELLSAFSAAEAREILQQRRDIAVALVDVVMEDDRAGLDLIGDVRGVFGNRLLRIILRTGQTGLAPELEVIQHFEIDDYRDKTELTSERLAASVITALRAYRTLQTLHQTAEGLESILVAGAVQLGDAAPSGDGRLDDSVIDAGSADGLEARPIVSTTGDVGGGSVKEYLRHVVDSFLALARTSDGPSLITDGVAVVETEEGPRVAYATGRFVDLFGRDLATLSSFDPAIGERMATCIARTSFTSTDEAFSMAAQAPSGERFAAYFALDHAPAPHVQRLLKVFVDRILLGIENARLAESILAAQRDAMTKLCEAIELRSKETGHHVGRVAAYARAFAKILGMAPKDAELLVAAAPLHDIGKVAIPDAILTKPGRLTDEEREVMKTHAQHGHDLLAGSEGAMLRLAAEIALTHHERHDGTGYPRGLAGSDIPFAGRIMSILDVFDALLSKRAYKEAIPIDRTIEILREESGRGFDPDLLKRFLDEVEVFHDIFLAHPDDPTATT